MICPKVCPSLTVTLTVRRALFVHGYLLFLSLSPVMIIGYYEKGHERGIESEMEKRKKEEK